MNLIQWEQNITLSAQEEDIVSSFEVMEALSHIQQQPFDDHPPQQEGMIKLIVDLMEVAAPQDALMCEIEGVLLNYQTKNEVFKVVLTNLATISQQLKQLELDKELVISGINQFHQQSNMYIQQQKSMIEMQNQIQEYLQYFLCIEKLSKDLDDSRMEQGLQRLMSEITDGLVFFTSKSAFHQSAKYLEQYKALKKKLITVTKNHFIRMLNKEFTFTNSQFSKLRFTEVLTLFYPFFVEYKDDSITIHQPNPMKLQFLQVVFPQFIQTMQIYDDDTKQGLKRQSNHDEQYEKFQFSVSLKNFCRFLEQLLDKDQEIHDLYNDVFLQFRSYFRLNLHQQISEQVAKQIQNISQLGSTLLKIKTQLTEQVINKSAPQIKFLQDVKSKQPLAQETLIFEILLAFIFELFINEVLYFKTIFTTTITIIEDNNHTLITQICDLHYQTIRNFILRVTNLDVLIQFAGEAKRLINSTKLFVAALPPNHYITRTMDDLHASEYLTKQMDLFRLELLDKTRMDLMMRVIALCHVEIQEQIHGYNMKEFYRQSGKLQIYKYVPPSKQQPKLYKLQRSDIFPTVQRGLTIILKLSEFVDKKIFEQLAGEILREVNNQIKEVAEKYELKFDSYLFFIKQLLILTEALVPLGGNFILKEQELDFTETKTMLLQLISGQIRPNIKWVELTSADKLWGYTTNFFQFIYKGIPKLNQYEVDLRHNMILLLKNVSFSFVKDMTFVICKNVIDFLRKYQYLQFIMTDKEAQLSNVVSADQAQMDLDVLLQRDNIAKTYVFFVENLFEFTDEMIAKLINYTDLITFEKFKPYIIDIIQNSISLLSQFYINVSKHYDGVDYDNFQFKTVDEVSKITLRRINYVEQ